MKPEEIRRRVLAAIEAGRILRGGPSELVARQSVQDAPPDYFERWGAQAADAYGKANVLLDWTQELVESGRSREEAEA